MLSADTRQDGLTQRGKLLLQPSAGWMAGFAGGQVLVIRFMHQPLAAIHPEQGQVELYLDAPPQHPEQGLLEMEVHAPYRQLAPALRCRRRSSGPCCIMAALTNGRHSDSSCAARRKSWG